MEILNMRRRQTVAEMARAIGLPRTTTFRILENLRDLGYLYRDDKDGRYRLTIKVKALSSGFFDDAWLNEIVKPIAEDLAKTVIWPISIIAPRGAEMSLRFTTDSESPLALDYYNEGLRLPILSTASGQVYLAYCSALEREVVLDALSRETPDETNILVRNTDALKNLLNSVRDQGYALNIRSPRTLEPGKTNTIALPIMRDGQFQAALAMRYIASAMNLEELANRYVPTLMQYRDQMQDQLNERNAH